MKPLTALNGQPVIASQNYKAGDIMSIDLNTGKNFKVNKQIGRPKQKSYAAAKEEIQIQEVRKALNMPPIKIGFRECLCCEKTFKSMDLNNMKTCVACRREDN